MRRMIMALLVLGALLAVHAQDPGVLKLSECQIAIKITDPAQQVQTFAPVLHLIEGLSAPAGPGSILALTSQVGMLKQAPGVNPRGDLWVAVPRRQLTPTNPAEMMRLDLKAYILVPLLDPQKFARTMAVITAMSEVPIPPMKVCGTYAVFALGAPAAPTFNTVTADLKLVSRRDLVISARTDLLPPDAQLPEIAGPAALLMAPLLAYQRELQSNIQRVEIGLALVGTDLSVETFVQPVPGSKLAKSLATVKPTTLPTTYAAYLPQHLAAYGADGPALAGMPDAGDALSQIFTSVFSVFLTVEQIAPVQGTLTALDDLCSHGWAYGITAPGQGPAPTLVAVFNVPDAETARTTLRGFMAETARARDGAIGGGLKEALIFDLVPDVDTVGEVKLDQLRIGLRNEVPVNPADPKAGMTMKDLFLLNMHAAYVDDKMLVAIGADTKAQVAAMVERVQQHTPGLADTAGFAALQASLPETAVSYSSVGTLDLLWAGIAVLPDNQGKQDLTKLLALFPPQWTTITSMGEVRNGLYHADARIPAEQLNLIYTTIKAAQLFRDEDAKKRAAAPQGPPIAHP